MKYQAENSVSSFFYYMWNAWSKEECEIVFGGMCKHFWENGTLLQTILSSVRRNDSMPPCRKTIASYWWNVLSPYMTDEVSEIEIQTLKIKKYADKHH